MNKHTPGPWHLSEKSPEMVMRRYDFLPESEGFVIGVVKSTDDTILSPSKEEAIANARLIATAPDLLESLSNLVGLARLGAAHLGKYHAALDHAEAIIAKARGES
ncbi:hypothetical protein C5U62_32030 [Pseudomonas protegens]|uniref:Uncharacterized protein n=1 Tax=Pseudomonas protegens TaxID=380021 RepID=A0A2T6GBD4_9PSED|nr:hypothetical protein [Pseudomonas protegens]PUA41463.1 hypothetical protein C5U62_32030 [Pseudomonas protegens]